MMHTELYCTELDKLDHTKAIRAIHQAWLQLTATAELAADSSYDNGPAIVALEQVLRDAGHTGFDLGDWHVEAGDFGPYKYRVCRGAGDSREDVWGHYLASEISVALAAVQAARGSAT